MYMKDGAGDAKLASTDVPEATLNMASAGPEPDPGEVDAFAREVSTTGVPWSIQLLREPDPALLDLAGRHNRTPSGTLPLLVFMGRRAAENAPHLRPGRHRGA